MTTLDLAPWPAMVMLCMVCRCFLGLKPVTLKGQDGMLSHGLCACCKAEMMDNLNQKDNQCK